MLAPKMAAPYNTFTLAKPHHSIAKQGEIAPTDTLESAI